MVEFNQGVVIGTKNGYTEFEQFSASGDSTNSSVLILPNELCINEFKRLIDY